jgi:sulfoxide reductase heme-binding subunit YedZ
MTLLKKPLRLSNAHILWLKITIHVLCLGFVAEMLYLTITDSVSGDPVDALLHFTGMGSLKILLITLAISPAARLLKAVALIRTRRLLGLYAFFYAVLHLITFVLFELQLEWGLIVEEIIKRPFITVGFVAWLILLALTVTSTKGSQRRLGRKWQKLHNLVYLAAPLVVIHFYWSVKSEIVEPIIYAVILIILLSQRKQLTNIIRKPPKSR